MAEETRSSGLLKLPNELLIKIVDLATETGSGLGGIDFALAKSLTLVSRRLRDITIPRLYERIPIGNLPGYHGPVDPKHSHALSAPRTAKLLGLVENDPSLQRLCRWLHIDMRDIWAREEIEAQYPTLTDKMKLIIDVISVFPKTRKFEIVGRIDDSSETLTPAWDIVCAAGRHLPDLEYVVLAHCCAASPAQMREPRFSSLTSLELFDLPGGPADLKHFLHGPKLERFAFRLHHPDDEDYVDRGGGPWSLPHVISLLESQEESLRFLRIGTFYNAETELCGSNLAKFTALQELHLVICDLANLTGHDEMFAAPHLRKLTWELHVDDHVTPGGFSRDDEACVRTLIQTAAAWKLSLREIEIVFQPKRWWEEEKEWPWDTMRVLEAEGQEVGIHVTWDEPDEMFDLEEE
ncbi:hypothetical protein QBC34DRAFT_440123 [Podospora aff. communis PSN243]|uniref:F-box domain-containing protein n=1 Tax=Podospora aff. communis PSN243 TaxID=3040156 RepID=A0AAV9GH81_9PEZI|nr:hypothetical protein QBC34DRAFT_440123 [Podospora aff. communis PSN243]